MKNIMLDGFWLIGALAVTYLVGVFTAQWAKDKLLGIPSDLRSALRVVEAGARTELSAAKAKLVADTVGLLNKGKAAVANDATKVAGAVAPKPVVIEAKPVVVEPVAVVVTKPVVTEVPAPAKVAVAAIAPAA